MEIPVIDYVTNKMDLCPISNNPLPYNFLSFPQTYILFKWGALVLALVASFTTLIKRVNILILKNSMQYSLQKSHVVSDNSDYDSDSESESESDSDDVDDTSSTSGSFSSVSDTEEDDRREECVTWRSGSVLDLASLFTTGKNVVKLWDNVADNGTNVLSSLFSPRNVVVSAERNLSEKFLRVWDTRVNDAWLPCVGRVKVNGNGGVVLRDDVSGGLAAGDVRKVGSPLVGVTEADVDRWWDANGAVSCVSWSED